MDNDDPKKITKISNDKVKINLSLLKKNISAIEKITEMINTYELRSLFDSNTKAEINTSIPVKFTINKATDKFIFIKSMFLTAENTE